MELKHIEVLEVRTECAKGSNIADCAREAAMLALEEMRVVTFVFNGKEYEVNPVTLVHSAIKQTQ